MLSKTPPSRSRNGSPMHHHPAYGGTASYKPDNMSVANELHPVIHAGRVALITGAASGIGYAAAIEFAKLGLKIAVADCDEKNLTQVGHELTTIVGESNVLVIPTDVSKLDQVVKLRDRVYEAWGEVIFLSPLVFAFDETGFVPFPSPCHLFTYFLLST